MKYCLTAVVCCIGLIAQAQHTFKVVIKSQREWAPIAGATITWNEGKQSAMADTAGRAIIKNIPAGKQSFTISSLAYEPKTVVYAFPMPSKNISEILLKEEHGE